MAVCPPLLTTTSVCSPSTILLTFLTPGASFDHRVAEQKALLAPTLQALVPTHASALAVDLGCGPGFQSIALRATRLLARCRHRHQRRSARRTPHPRRAPADSDAPRRPPLARATRPRRPRRRHRLHGRHHHPPAGESPTSPPSSPLRVHRTPSPAGPSSSRGAISHPNSTAPTASSLSAATTPPS